MILKPYKIQGRWYKLFIEIDSENEPQITTKDLSGVEMSGTTIKFPVGFHVLDKILDLHVEGGSSSSVTTISSDLRRYANGQMGVTVPDSDLFDYADVYIYGYFSE